MDIPVLTELKKQPLSGYEVMAFFMEDSMF